MCSLVINWYKVKFWSSLHLWKLFLHYEGQKRRRKNCFNCLSMEIWQITISTDFICPSHSTLQKYYFPSSRTGIFIPCSVETHSFPVYSLYHKKLSEPYGKLKPFPRDIRHAIPVQYCSDRIWYYLRVQGNYSCGSINGHLDITWCSKWVVQGSCFINQRSLWSFGTFYKYVYLSIKSMRSVFVTRHLCYFKA